MNHTVSSGLADAEQIAKRRMCLEPVSKNVRGDLRLLDADREECKDPDCLTLKTDHVLKVEVTSNKPCDSKAGLQLDGVLYVRRLVTALSDGTGEGRGLHAGEFHWAGDGVRIKGDLAGMTNVGTHREPVFDDCQKCHDPGYMEGRLCGRIVRAKDERLVGCEVTAVYRIKFDPSQGFQDTAVEGTIEGLVVCSCGGGSCLDLSAFAPGQHANPWAVSGYEFEVLDWTGAVTPTADVIPMGGHTGLNANYSTRVVLPGPANSVDITLIHFSSPATVTAYDGSGAAVDSATMTVGGVPETLTLSGPGITSLLVKPPQNETLILEICPS